MINRKKIICILRIVFAVISLLIMYKWFSGMLNMFEGNPLKNIRSESVDVPNYVVYDTLYSDYGKVNIDMLCDKKYNKDCIVMEILCVYEENAYFVYSIAEKGDHKWVLASLHLKTMNVQPLCEILNDSIQYNYGGRMEDYKKRNAYYYDGLLVLNNYKDVMTYDLEMHTTQRYPYEEYEFPEYEVVCSAYHPEKLHLNIDHKSYIFDLQEISKEYDTISEIYKLKEKKNWDDVSYLFDFWTEESVRVIDDKIYTVGRCLNYNGESYAVIMEYDCTLEKWRYIKSVHVGDIAYRYCYIIP